MKIYISRHGQVMPKEFFQSVDFPSGDIPLSETGKKQAACLGNALKALHFQGRILSSPYRRTMMTANIAADVCGAFIYPRGELREMFFSDEAGESFTGMRLETLQTEFPHVAESAVLPYPWWTTKKDSLEGIAKRLHVFWETLCQEKYEEVLLIGHGASVFGSMHYINERFSLGMPAELSALGEYLATRNLNCNLSFVEIGQDGTLKSAELFDTSHLPEELLTSNSTARPRPEQITV